MGGGVIAANWLRFFRLWASYIIQSNVFKNKKKKRMLSKNANQKEMKYSSFFRLLIVCEIFKVKLYYIN